MLTRMGTCRTKATLFMGQDTRLQYSGQRLRGRRFAPLESDLADARSRARVSPDQAIKIDPNISKPAEPCGQTEAILDDQTNGIIDPFEQLADVVSDLCVASAK